MLVQFSSSRYISQCAFKTKQIKEKRRECEINLRASKNGGLLILYMLVKTIGFCKQDWVSRVSQITLWPFKYICTTWLWTNIHVVENHHFLSKQVGKVSIKKFTVTFMII
jgi:hypothetical protein